MDCPVLDVTSWPRDAVEWLGDQEKEWLLEPGATTATRGGKWLFKPSRRTEIPGRAGASSHWFTWFEAHVEWIAHQLAARIGVPSATIRLARRGPTFGSLSRDVRPFDADLHSGDVYLAGIPGLDYVPNVVRARNRSGHHLDAIDQVLDGVEGPEHGVSARQAFAGYLVLDAWIGNTDRHAENWALTVSGGRHRMAASFDHGSALAAGREDSFLARTDPREFADGAMARKFDRGKNVSLVALARQAMTRWGGPWLDELGLVEADFERVVVAAPPGLSDLRRTFMSRLLEENRRRLTAP